MNFEDLDRQSEIKRFKDDCALLDYDKYIEVK